MKITNKFGLPQPFLTAIERDSYSRGEANISVTQLIASPRINALRQKHYADMTIDVSDRFWALMGQAIHAILESGGDDRHLTEERLFADAEGWIVSGAIDLQRTGEKPNGIRLNDYKFTTVSTLGYPKPEWEQQLNCYAWLVRSNKPYDIEELAVYAILRDWKQGESKRIPGYPTAPIQKVSLPIWPETRTKKFVNDRVRLHQDAIRALRWDENCASCTDDDRWVRGTTWRVMKPNGKRALRTFTVQSEAEAFAAERERRGLPTEIVKRPGSYVRCEGNYCGVAQWCDQWNCASNGGLNGVKERSD